MTAGDTIARECEVQSPTLDKIFTDMLEEMHRRMGNEKYIWETAEDFSTNPEWLPVDDTQIGIEFAFEYLRPFLGSALTASGHRIVSTEGEAVEGFEEALRLAEVGEYLYSACAYSYGDGYTEPREYGIEWQWQQSKPDEFGQGQLLAAATKWHREQLEDGIETEATKLRAAIAATPHMLMPAGWVLVPEMPTWEMEVAGRDVLCDTLDDDAATYHARDAYRAMLSAAPKPAALTQEPKR